MQSWGGGSAVGAHAAFTEDPGLTSTTHMATTCDSRQAHGTNMQATYPNRQSKNKPENYLKITDPKPDLNTRQALRLSVKPPT